MAESAAPASLIPPVKDHMATLTAALKELDPGTEAEPEAAPAPEAEAAPTPEQPEADAPAPAPEQPKGIRALSDDQLIALRRAQIADADLEGLSDAALAKLADTALKLRTNYDRAFDEAKNPKKTPEARAPQQSEGAGKAAAPDPDLNALADPVRKALGLSEDEGKVLADYTRQIVSAAQAATMERLQAAEGAAASANQRVGALLADAAMDELQTLWPQLSEARNRDAVRKHAAKIAEGYEHLPLRTGMTECLRDACKRELGDPKAKPAAAPQPDARARATPTAPNGRKPDTRKPKTAAERNLAIVAGLDAGKSERTIARELGL
jgi:hypothetical protein